MKTKDISNIELSVVIGKKFYFFDLDHDQKQSVLHHAQSLFTGETKLREAVKLELPMAISNLIEHKKALIQQVRHSPDIVDSLTSQIEDIEKKINARVSRSDHNFLKMFYQKAQRLLPADDFNKVQNVASTRVNQYKQGNKKGKS